MRGILLSMQPQWVEKILSGEKTIEIRKTAPNCELPAEVYVYCAKGDFLFHSSYDGAYHICPKHDYWNRKKPISAVNPLNGKIVAKFTLNCIGDLTGTMAYGGYEDLEEILKAACISYDEMQNYAKGKEVYFWNIGNLQVFDKPMELERFYTPCDYAKVYDFDKICCFETKNCQNFKDGKCKKGYIPLTRPPQSWQFIKVIK